MTRLAHGDTVLELAPDVGGGIAALRWRGHDVMRAATPETLAARDPLGLASFPLVPWSNRIADGRFTWRGRPVALPLNMAGHPHAIHGHGWQQPWVVGECDARTAVLTYAHAADAWPWDYVARQRFTVVADGFDLALSVTNTGSEAMPAGLGIHPYFTKAPGTRLHARADGWWRTDRFIIPTDYVHAPADDWTAKLHGTTTTDNVFAGFDGHARLALPAPVVDLRASDAARWMVVYAPVGEAICVVEPVTHPTNALNDPALPGIRVVAPGETFTLDVAVRISD